MFDKLQFIDNQLDYTKPFVGGFYVDGSNHSPELLDANMLKRLMMGKGYFLLISDEEIYSIFHSWAEGGFFGSFIIQHHHLNEPGTPFRELEIHKYYPSMADFLTGEINAFQKIADEIIEMFHESGSIIEKLIKDLSYFMALINKTGNYDDDLKSLFEQMGINNNEFK